MAGPSEKEKEKTVPSSRPLHNFKFPPNLQWGNQKQLRCVKLPNYPQRSPNSAAPFADHRRGGEHRSSSPISVPRGPLFVGANKNVKSKSQIGISSSSSGGGGDSTGIEEVREKLINDLKVAADRLKIPIQEKNQKKPLEEELPWNLRNRRPLFKASNEGGNGNVGSSDMTENNGSGDHQQQKRARFSNTLSKEEIETDFLLMTGAKPQRRPKKWPKAVRKQMEGTFPGSWLTDITPEYYKVSDTHESKGDK